MRKFTNLDSRPYTGQYRCEPPIKVKLVDLEKHEHMKGYFNGTEKYVQIKNITADKVYECVGYEVLGDVADITIIDDSGEEQELMECFFEEVE